MLFTIVIFGVIIAWIARAFRKSGSSYGMRQSARSGQWPQSEVVNGVAYTDSYVEMLPTSQPDNLGGMDNSQGIFVDNPSFDAGSSADFSAGQNNSGGTDFSSSGSSTSTFDSGGNADFSSSSSSSSDFSSSDSGSSSGGDY